MYKPVALLPKDGYTENTASTVISAETFPFLLLSTCRYRCFSVKRQRDFAFFDISDCQNPQTKNRCFMQFFSHAKKRRSNLWVFTNKIVHFSKKHPLLFYFITFLTHLKSKIFLTNIKNLNRLPGIFPMTAKSCVSLAKIVVQTAIILCRFSW